MNESSSCVEIGGGVLGKYSDVAMLRREIADLELRVSELERKTTIKELARAVARHMLAVGTRE